MRNSIKKCDIRAHYITWAKIDTIENDRTSINIENRDAGVLQPISAKPTSVSKSFSWINTIASDDIQAIAIYTASDLWRRERGRWSCLLGKLYSPY